MEQVSILDDRYELGEVVGRGGSADVFRATDLVLGRVVAVKVLRDWTTEGSERERFHDEARTLARLSHPGLTTILDAGVRADHPYLVMELVEGSTLAECCASRPLSADRVATIGIQLADALAYAHEQGVVHRDVKPSNVLLAEDGQALLTDFGIARLLSETTHRTRTGTTIGSPAYLAPEQVRGEPSTTAVDVYSLGLVLLEALTGSRAFEGSPTEAAVARLTAAPAVPEHLPTPWVDLLRAMTDADPTSRPSARAVANALRAISADPPSGDPTRTLVLTHPGLDGPPTAPEQHWSDRIGDHLMAALRQLVRRSAAGVRRAGDALPETSTRQRHQALVIGLLAVAAILMFTVAATTSDGGGRQSPTVPDRLPSNIEQPLRDLHRAINGDDQ